MRHLLTEWYTRPLIIYLVAALLFIACFTGPAEAMFLAPAPDQAPAASTGTEVGRAADLAAVRNVLESKAVRQRLMDNGLTPEEAAARINALSDEQLHQLAANLDSVQAGGDVLGFLLFVTLAALLVILIIFALEGRISVQRR